MRARTRRRELRPGSSARRAPRARRPGAAEAGMRTLRPPTRTRSTLRKRLRRLRPREPPGRERLPPPRRARPPSRARPGRPSRALRGSARGRREISNQSPLEQILDDLLCAAPVVLDLDLVAARGRRSELEHGRLRARLADQPDVDADRREVEGLLRLRLRSHDPLEGGVAGLVD